MTVGPGIEGRGEMRNSRVLVIAGTFPEVTQTFVVDHISGLVESGWDVHIAARRLYRDQLDKYGLAHVAAHELTNPHRGDHFERMRSALGSVGFRGIRHLASVSVRAASYYAPSLRQLVNQTSPAVIHAHFAQNGLLASMSAGRWCPVIVNFHGYDVMLLARKEGWKHFAPFLDGTHGIVHSSFLEQEVAGHLDIRLHRVTLGVDHELFRGRDRGERWPDAVTLLTVGRLEKVKGHDVAIRAFGTLVAGGVLPRGRLIVVGDGPERQDLEELAGAIGVGDRVEFHGSVGQKRVAEVMAEADFLLVPSLPLGGWQEAFGRVAVEGLASGLAVIGTRAGGLAETIGAGGWVVDPGDHLALADKVREILMSLTPYEAAERSRAQSAQFGIERMRDDYNTVTRSVVCAM